MPTIFRKNKVIFSAAAIAIVIVFVAALFWFFGRSPSQETESKKNSSGNSNIQDSLALLSFESINDFLPSGLNFENQNIAFTWTDENEKENLIIQSDKKYYHGNNQSEVYFSITNLSPEEQNTDIVFWFDGKEKYASNVQKIASAEKQSDPILLQQELSVSNQFSPPDSNSRKDTKNFSAPSYFKDYIGSGQTNFYKVAINFPNGSQGEFFIEAFGRNGGYGHLDPYFASGLVGYWSFNGPDINWGSQTVYDRSGAGNNGTAMNMSTSSSPIPGVSGQALKFDGENDWVDLPNNTYIDEGAGTVALWYKSGNDSSFNLFGFNASGCSILMIYRNGNTTMRSQHYVNCTGTTDVIDTTVDNLATVQPNWHFFVFSWDVASDVLATFYDGTYKSQADDLDTGSFGSENTAIGSQDDGTGNFNGSIDEVRVYNRALTESEIVDLYRSDLAKTKTIKSQKNYNASGLVGYWSFDGADVSWGSQTAYDRSVQGNNGTITNMSTSSSPVSGINGQALKFDGVNDYFDVADDTSFDSLDGQANFTVSFWFKTTVPGGNMGSNSGETIIERRRQGDVTERQFRFGIHTGGYLGFEIGTDASYTIINSSSIINDGKWYHGVGVRQGTSLWKLYINGVEEDSSSSEKSPESGYWLTIGCRITDAGAKSEYFNGSLDEVRVYNRALSEQEIKDLYNAGAARTQTNTSIKNAGSGSGLVGNWTFNGPDINWATQTAYDRSGQGNNATIYNMSTSSSPSAGVSGQALRFGTNQYLTAPNLNVFGANISDGTFSAWAKPNLADPSSCYQNGAYYYLFNFHVLSNTTFSFYYAGDSSQRFYSSISCSSVINTASSSCSSLGGVSFLKNWHHYVVKWTSTGSIYLYVDGILKDSGTANSLSCSSTPTYYIGRSGGGSSFYGLIDEVRVYNRVLTEQEIQALYNAGLGRTKMNNL